MVQGNGNVVEADIGLYSGLIGKNWSIEVQVDAQNPLTHHQSQCSP